MDEFGGLDTGAPDEGIGGAQEAASESASQRFAASQAAAKAQQSDERKAKKRDTSVAQTILQFLTDAQRAHLATLIARLVARDCPSPFLLAVLSLINRDCTAALQEYLRDTLEQEADAAMSNRRVLIQRASGLTGEAAQELTAWMSRMELALALNPDVIIRSLLVDAGTFDTTLLQLTSFVLEEFLKLHGKSAPFEQLQKLAAATLQSIFAPHVEGLAPQELRSAEDGETG
jgi:cytochrome c553